MTCIVRLFTDWPSWQQWAFLGISLFPRRGSSAISATKPHFRLSSPILPFAALLCLLLSSWRIILCCIGSSGSLLILPPPLSLVFTSPRLDSSWLRPESIGSSIKNALVLCPFVGLNYARRLSSIIPKNGRCFWRLLHFSEPFFPVRFASSFRCTWQCPTSSRTIESSPSFFCFILLPWSSAPLPVISLSLFLAVASSSLKFRWVFLSSFRWYTACWFRSSFLTPWDVILSPSIFLWYSLSCSSFIVAHWLSSVPPVVFVTLPRAPLSFFSSQSPSNLQATWSWQVEPSLLYPSSWCRNISPSCLIFLRCTLPSLSLWTWLLRAVHSVSSSLLVLLIFVWWASIPNLSFFAIRCSFCVLLPSLIFPSSVGRARWTSRTLSPSSLQASCSRVISHTSPSYRRTLPFLSWSRRSGSSCYWWLLVSSAPSQPHWTDNYWF